MAAALARRNSTFLLSKHSSFLLCKPHHVSLSLHFSTARGKQPLDTPTISKFLTQKHHFSPESASQVASVVTQLKNLENADSVLSFLKETGFSKTQLEKAVKLSPKLLSANPAATIKPKFGVLQDLGFTADEIVDVVSKNPFILQLSVNRLVSSVSVLKGLLRSNVEVAKFLRPTGFFLRDLEKTLVPNVEFLKSCGVPADQIVRLMKIPRFFLHKPETMRKFVQKADDLGFDRESRRFACAVQVVSSMTNETWELKLKALRELGFTEDDILRVFRNVPAVFAVSEKKIKKVTEVLLETGKYSMLCIVHTPTVFLYSIEKRHRPRLQVLRVLEEKNLIRRWPSLGTMHLIPDAKFVEKFVAPYLDEVGGVWRSAVSGKGEAKLKEL